MTLLHKLAPTFTLKNQNEEEVSLEDCLGKGPIILYFYPKDMTSGCTKEACDFRDNLNRLTKSGAQVFGISKDAPKTHKKFIEKEGLTFDLLSDPEGIVCDAYGVWKEKSMYGRTYFGIERSTFLLDKEGNVVQEWRKVSVPGHVEDVLEKIERL